MKRKRKQRGMFDQVADLQVAAIVGLAVVITWCAVGLAHWFASGGSTW